MPFPKHATSSGERRSSSSSKRLTPCAAGDSRMSFQCRCLPAAACQACPSRSRTRKISAGRDALTEMSPCIDHVRNMPLTVRNRTGSGSTAEARRCRSRAHPASTTSRRYERFWSVTRIGARRPAHPVLRRVPATTAADSWHSSNAVASDAIAAVRVSPYRNCQRTDVPIPRVSAAA